MKGCKSTIDTSQVSLSNKSRNDSQFYQLKRWYLFLPLEEERFQPPWESRPPHGAQSTAATCHQTSGDMMWDQVPGINAPRIISPLHEM